MNLLDKPDLVWDHYTGDEGRDDPSFSWPIDYWGAILDIRDDGHVDVLYRWEPNSYCHFHRHTAPTTSTVLAGELHVTDIVDGEQQETQVRKVGDYAHRDCTEDHIEMGGPEGALVMFSIYAPDGVLSQRLAKDGSVQATITTDMLRERQEALL